MSLRIFVSRHSAFYSPLISCITAGFLKVEGLDSTYTVLAPGQTSAGMLREGKADVIQSSVSSNWPPIQRGETELPVHFALINRRDGFFLAARPGIPVSEPFRWKDLEGRTLLADFGGQPLAMLKYAVHHNGADFTKIRVVDRGAPDKMVQAFRDGEGDYIHLQGPAPHELEEDGQAQIAVSVGASMPETAFSTACCSSAFTRTAECRAFVRAFTKARLWVQEADPREVVEKQHVLFPSVSATAMRAAVDAYQKLGTWTGGIEITPDRYNQTVAVFESASAVQKRIPWEQVCVKPPV